MPQLLRYPNPADPLNGEAAALLMRDPKAYAKKVETYVQRYATPADADGDEDEDKMGGVGSYKPKRKLTSEVERETPSKNGKIEQKKDEEAEEDDDEDEEDKMSDMGELSDGDEFMGEMDD